MERNTMLFDIDLPTTQHLFSNTICSTAKKFKFTQIQRKIKHHLPISKMMFQFASTFSDTGISAIGICTIFIQPFLKIFFNINYNKFHRNRIL